MILTNKKLHAGYGLLAISCIKALSFFFFLSLFSSCGVYTFRDVSIPPEVKTIKINYLENKARYVNPQLSPRLTDALQQKVSNQTRLTRTTNDDAHYQVSGYVSGYDVTTAGISSQQTNLNRLTVRVHILFRNALEDKNQEFDISRDFDFSGNLAFNQAEAQLFNDVLKNVSDEIFNRIFSNW
jgi:hypothetical protein